MAFPALYVSLPYLLFYSQFFFFFASLDSIVFRFLRVFFWNSFIFIYHLVCWWSERTENMHIPLSSYKSSSSSKWNKKQHRLNKHEWFSWFSTWMKVARTRLLAPNFSLSLTLFPTVCMMWWVRGFQRNQFQQNKNQFMVIHRQFS